MAVLSCLVILTSIFAGSFAVSAASDPIRVTDAKIKIYDQTNNLYYIIFTLSEPIHNARHFQNTGRVFEADVPSDSWDFPDALVDAGLNDILINGTTVGEYNEALGSVFNVCLFFQKEDNDTSKDQWFIIKPPTVDMDLYKNDWTIEVKQGMISAEYKKFEPFTAKWDHEKQELNVYRQNDNGLSLAEVKNGGSSSPSVTASGDNSKNNNSDNSASSNIGSSDVSDTTSSASTKTTVTTTTTKAEIVNTFLPTLGKFDLSSKSSDVVINFDEKKITLAKSMTVGEFLSDVEAVEGYDIGVYNGANRIDDKDNVFSNYHFKVLVSGEQIGNFVITAPTPSNTAATVLLIVGIAVVVLAGIGAAVFLIIKRKKKG